METNNDWVKNVRSLNLNNSDSSSKILISDVKDLLAKPGTNEQLKILNREIGKTYFISGKQVEIVVPEITPNRYKSKKTWSTKMVLKDINSGLYTSSYSMTTLLTVGVPYRT